MKISEFHEMIDKAEDDISHGRVISTDDLLKRAEKWR